MADETLSQQLFWARWRFMTATLALGQVNSDPELGNYIFLEYCFITPQGARYMIEQLVA